MSARWILGLVFGSVVAASSACSSSDDDADPGGQAGTTAGMSGAGGSSTGGQGSGGSENAGTGGTAGDTAGSGGTSGDGGTSGSAGAGGNAAASGSGAGGTGAVPDLPAVDPETNLRDLTPADKAELCDWNAETLGGYGKKTTCSNGSTVQNYADQAQCVALGFTFSCLIVTVGDVERCTIARMPSGGCVSPTEECEALYCVE